MQAVKTIGLDIAKSIFQVHGVDADGLVVIRRKLKRRYVLAFFQKVPSCLIGMEACATSHHWSLGGESDQYLFSCLLFCSSATAITSPARFWSSIRDGLLD